MLRSTAPRAHRSPPRSDPVPPDKRCTRLPTNSRRCLPTSLAAQFSTPAATSKAFNRSGAVESPSSRMSNGSPRQSRRDSPKFRTCTRACFGSVPEEAYSKVKPPAATASSALLSASEVIPRLQNCSRVQAGYAEPGVGDEGAAYGTRQALTARRPQFCRSRSWVPGKVLSVQGKILPVDSTLSGL